MSGHERIGTTDPSLLQRLLSGHASGTALLYPKHKILDFKITKCYCLRHMATARVPIILRLASSIIIYPEAPH